MEIVEFGPSTALNKGKFVKFSNRFRTVDNMFVRRMIVADV